MARLLRPLAVMLAATTLAVVVACAVLTAVAEGDGIDTNSPPWFVLLPALLITLGTPTCVGVFVAWRRPRNPVPWILVIGPLTVALAFCGDAVATVALHDDPDSVVGRWGLLVAQEWVTIFLWPLALAWVYPDGRLPGGRWRLAARLAIVNSALIVLLLAAADQLEQSSTGDLFSSPLPVSLDRDTFTPVFWVLWVGLVLSLAGGAAVLRRRYKNGTPIERRQILWLAYGVLLLPIWLGGGSLVSALIVDTSAADMFVLGTLQVWPAVAVAVAVTRHGLYGIDRLFNRTLVYLTLSVLLLAAYGIVALVVGSLADSALTASLATLAAALLFRPVRDRVQTRVDRRFARARFDTERQLAGFLDDVRAGRAEPEDVSEAIALAVGDPSVEVLFRLPETGAYADRTGQLVDLPSGGERAQTAITSGDRELGVLLHSARLAEEPDVLRAVAHSAAVPVELARLRVELRLQLAEVESSRARIAQAGYAERRRLERDLHDGAQQRLVTLGIMLRRLQRSLPKEAQVLSPAFDSAVGEVSSAIGDLRTIAAGVRPPRLDEGLAAALADLARNAEIPVHVEASAERAPPEVEAAAYFIACEALTNSIKHGIPSRVSMSTARDNGLLRLEVVDDGIGGAATARGSGIEGMHDRVAAQGGTILIESPPGAGTRVSVELPCGS